MSPAALPLRLRGTPLLVLSSLLFALMAFFARLTSGHLGVGQLVCARFLIGLAFLAVYFRVRGQRPRFGRPWLWAARGVFGGAAVFLYFMAIERLAVGPATLLNSLWPLWAALFSLLFLKERVSSHLGAGLLLTTLGAGLVVWSTVPAGGSALAIGVGAWAGIASAVLSGAAVTVVRALRSDTDSATVFLSFNLFGFLFALPFAPVGWQPLTWELLWPVLGVGLTSVAAQMLLTYALGYVSTATGGVTTQLTPAFSWMMGALLLGEPVLPLALAGALVCVGGVLWGTGVHLRLFVSLRVPQATAGAGAPGDAPGARSGASGA